MKRLVCLVVLAVLGTATAAQAQYVEYADHWRSSRLVKVERLVRSSPANGGITYSTPVYYPEPVAYGESSADPEGREVYLTEPDRREDEERRQEGYGDYGGQGTLAYHGVAEGLPPPPEERHHGHGHHGHDDLGCCECRDIFLGCVFPCGNKGSFVLRCDGTGVATYFLERRCVRAAMLEKIGQDRCFVYYRECESPIKWAFSREPVADWHRVWISHRRNPLDADWRRFCMGKREDDCYEDHHHCHH